MEDKNKLDFNGYEKIFLKISIGLLSFGIILFGTLFLIVDYLSELANLLSAIAVLLLVASIASFITSIVRIAKYIFSVKNKNKNASINRTIISFFLSPLAIIVYYFIMIILALSSCTVN